ncbi:MAG: hypothetical protein JXA33_04200 [Anaerolineae bacterium]|nr:hypothetical protein [Anaerolineae bacterium]
MQAQSSSIKTWLFFLIPALILASILMWVFQDFVREVVVVPVLYFMWMIDIILDMVPQTLIWALMLGIAFFMILKSFDKYTLSSHHTSEPASSIRGKVEVWAQRIYLRNRGAYSKERFAYYLGKLIQDVLVYEAHYTPKEIIQRIETGELVLPPEVESYLLFRLRPAVSPTRNWLQRLKDTLMRWIRREPSFAELSNDELVSVLEFLEKQLEISTGGSG